MRLFTSRMSGTLRTTTSSCVSKVAQMICRASFLAPWGRMSPPSLCPPSMMNDAMALLVFPAFLAVVVSVIVVGAVVIVLVVWPAIAVDALVHHAQDVGRDLEASLGQFG